MIVITAPTSNIGHQVLANILDTGEPIRVIARDPARLPARTRECVEVVQGSHGDFNVVSQAFAGADTVFWLLPPSPVRKASRRPIWTSPDRLARRSRARESGAWLESQPSAEGLRSRARPG
jgi:uncharacterized protein YbjT (DUF2867 family)